MKSIINSKNIGNLPLPYIFVILVIYLCPNIRLLSIGEMSSLPAFLILFTYSFLSITEICIFGSIFVLLIFSFLLYAINLQSYEVTFQSILISFYILSVPLILSIIIGKLFAVRFTKLPKIKIIKEIKYLVYFFVFIFTLTGLINYFLPTLLPLILFTGRTSFGRFTFFFSEPSQASSVILFLWFFAMQFLFNRQFIKYFGRDYYVYFFITLTLAILTTFLTLPGTLIMQLFISFSVIPILYFGLKFTKILFQNGIRIKRFSNLLKFKKINFIFYLVLIFFLGIILQNIFFKVEENASRVDFLFSQLDNLGILEGLITAGGFRFYYAFASLKYSIYDLFNLPGNWVGSFQSDLISSLSSFSIKPDDNLLQLSKDPITIKPLGWFYFCIYDLGILGFLAYLYLTIGKYLKGLFRGILNLDLFFITIFAFQFAIMVVPVLPSTPSIFIPLLLLIFNINLKRNLAFKV